MIYERDLDESIARYQGETNPSINTCIKLAACYALKKEMFGKSEQQERADYAHSYSFAAGPPETVETLIDYTGDTDFARAVDGKIAAEVWPIMDQLMSALRVVEPTIYTEVMRELQK